MHKIYMPVSNPIFSCTFNAVEFAGAGATNTVRATHPAGVKDVEGLRSPCAFGCAGPGARDPVNEGVREGAADTTRDCGCAATGAGAGAGAANGVIMVLLAMDALLGRLDEGAGTEYIPPPPGEGGGGGITPILLGGAPVAPEGGGARAEVTPGGGPVDVPMRCILLRYIKKMLGTGWDELVVNSSISTLFSKPTILAFLHR